ncbi:hypothetical protein BjapCC829_23750 [Bradyrhizobium barranii]|uniref:Uncharacterized protein n=1 Tax=Bradyrhizobium barranii TaxID=2992140 RepID=A0ABY3QB26_9BRAD|nr:hypothetical protein [Bradyrhizobium japonicum]UFW83003.1 hypothetical protein BjapCC829_23750 [Bradyrhizobium japonicum]
MSNLEVRNENLIEVLKRNGDFSKNYGPWLGAFLLWLAMKAAKPKSVWWTGLIGLGTVAGGLVLKYGAPAFF